MPKAPLTPADDPAWSDYAETILEIGTENSPLRLDLRKPLTERDRHSLATVGPTSRFGIVTAANPAGAPVAPASNAARHDALERHLREHGFVHRAATGSSPGGEHTERGFAIWLGREDVVAIAKRFEQSAISGSTVAPSGWWARSWTRRRESCPDESSARCGVRQRRVT